MTKEEIRKYKQAIKPGMMRYMEKKDPGKSESTYSTYVSDSNYLLNNDLDAYLDFMKADKPMPQAQDRIRELLIEHRGAEKVTDGGAYYYEKLCWHKEYIDSTGGMKAGM